MLPSKSDTKRGKAGKARYEVQELEDLIQEKGKGNSQEDDGKCVSGMESNEYTLDRSEGSRSDICKEKKLVNFNKYIER